MTEQGALQSPAQLKPFARFESQNTQHHLNGILFCPEEQLERVDTSGRILRDNNRCAVP